MHSVVILLAACLGLISSALADVPSGVTRTPNIVFIITDDQDVRLDSMSYMPRLHQRMVEEGSSYLSHYCTVSLCCPSRVSLLTGKAAHNTNVTDVQAPYGGYSKFTSQGLNSKYLPVWLQDQGYATYYIGKLFNEHHLGNYNKPFPAGWNGSDFLLDPFQYAYWTPAFQRNQDAPVIHEHDYVTDLVTQKSIGFLDDAVKTGKPFFLGVAPNAPHSQVDTNLTTLVSTSSPPKPAPRHKHLFPNAQVPRSPSFNPHAPSGASWVKELPRLNSTQVTQNDDWHRSRLQALQAVDDMVDAIFERLETHGLLDNTYIFYTSDNGFHISQHRMGPGKTCGYEEDINVPFIVRGPGIRPGTTFDGPTSHTDIVPTLFKLIGRDLPDDLDGVPIPIGAKASSAARKQEHVGIEFWGRKIPDEGTVFDAGREVNNTYKSIRLIGEGYNLYYSVWCTNEKELYDMTTDPYQMDNLVDANGPCRRSTDTMPFGKGTVEVSRLLNRLDGLLLVTKSCAGLSCRDPWSSLAPDGQITSLADAMDPALDGFFEQLPRVSFTDCLAGQIISAEGPQFSANDAYHAASLDGTDPQWAMRT